MATKRKSSFDPDQITQRFDSTVDKFATALSTMATSIGVHAERINNVDDSFKRLEQRHHELMNKSEVDYRHLDEKIDQVRDDITQHFDAAATRLATEYRDTIINLSTRVRSLEQWRWMILGGVAVMIILFEIGRLLATSTPLMHYFFGYKP